MSRDPRDLRRIQQWMHSVITHPSGVIGGMRSDSARTHIDVSPEDAEQIINRSHSLTSLQRLEVYANAYYARLLECLRSEYPALLQAVGQDAFDAFAFGYLQRYPSRSYTLAQLGANFPTYLRETRPPSSLIPSSPHPLTPSTHLFNDPRDEAMRREGDEVSEADWADFIIDLATLERHYSEVFDGPGVEGQTLLQTDDLLAVPPDRWHEARLIPVVCLRLVSFRFPVHEYASAVRRGEKPTPPLSPPSQGGAGQESARTYLAITRRDYIVRRCPLSHPQYELLRALMEGSPLGDAITHAAEAAEINLDGLAKHLEGWFREWSAADLFQSVELSR